MKKLWLIALLLLMPLNVFAFLGVGALKDKVKGLIGEVSLVKVGVAQNADALAKFQTDVNVKFGQIDAKIDARATAAATAAIGFNNRQHSESIGGNKVTNTKNSDAVVKEILWTYRAIIVTLIVQMVVLLKYQANLYSQLLEAKDKWIANMIESSSKKDERADDWLRKYIEELSKKR